MKENGKWFAVIMHVSRSRLGLPGPGSVEVINLKDTPQEVKKRLETDGFLRADHMDRTNWYTVCLDDTDKQKLCAGAKQKTVGRQRGVPPSARCEGEGNGALWHSPCTARNE